jgi:hypothetical protein
LSHASIISIHSPPQLHFEPPQLLNFDSNADADPNSAFESLTLKHRIRRIRIRIRITALKILKATNNNASFC